MFQQVLEASLAEKKGVMLYVKGQSIPGIVTKVNADSVELRSREYSRIVVKLESIDAVASVSLIAGAPTGPDQGVRRPTR